MHTQNSLRLLILSLLLFLGLASCSDTEPTPAVVPTASPIPTMAVLSIELPDDENRAFLVADDAIIPLEVQHLSVQMSIYGFGLPQTNDSYPVVLFRPDGIYVENLFLRRMIGGIGFSPKPDTELGGVLVEAVKPGFGAETGGLLVGDLILAIDDQPLQEMLNYPNVYDRLGEMVTGELGSRVSLTVRRADRVIDLTIIRNLPTLPSVGDITTNSIPYQMAVRADNSLQLAPSSALSAGLYCYQSGASRSSFGNLYCFLQGDVDVAWPIPPVMVASEPSAPSALFASPNFEVTDCRFPIQSGQVVECADLIVPEVYNQPEGGTIRLHVAVFRSSSNSQPDPVIYLHGGPGGGALDWASAAYESGYQYLFPDRYFIVYDQRGTGYSLPRLDCPSLVDEYARTLSEDQRVSTLAWEAANMGACRENLESRNINLSAYTTQANAADLDALIEALGYEQVNLIGQSDGSNLALTYMQEFGSKGFVRSTILDGIFPPQADLYLERGVNAQSAWEAVFAACEADPACQDAYPDIEARFYQLLESLAAEPITVDTVNPLSGQPLTVIVNDFRFIEAIYRSSYQSDWISRIPALIATVEQGDETLLAPALSNILSSAAAVDHGVYFSVLCSDGAASMRANGGQTENSQLPPGLELYFADIAQGMQAVCGNWPIAPASPAQAQPAASDIPTLLLSGTFDPITTPAWARLAADALSNGYLIEFPANSHDLLGSSTCAQRLVYQFVENPGMPLDACLDALENPVFEIR
jgi:pimeloyl-ACP methyl ester carboxylesterase